MSHENEDPFSLHNPQNTPNSNTRSRNEWEANQSILSVTDSTKFSFTIDNESLYEKFKYEKLQLQKKETHLIRKNNQSFDIWLIIGSKGIPIVDINLYAADRVTWHQNMVKIHLNRLSHFHLCNPVKRESLSNQSKPDASIVLCGDKSMHEFFEFIQYLNVHTPGDAQMPSSFRVLVPSLNKNPRKRNRANPSGFTLDKKLVFQRMDIEEETTDEEDIDISMLNISSKCAAHDVIIISDDDDEEETEANLVCVSLPINKEEPRPNKKRKYEAFAENDTV